MKTKATCGVMLTVAAVLLWLGFRTTRHTGTPVYGDITVRRCFGKITEMTLDCDRDGRSERTLRWRWARAQWKESDFVETVPFNTNLHADLEWLRQLPELSLVEREMLRQQGVGR